MPAPISRSQLAVLGTGQATEGPPLPEPGIWETMQQSFRGADTTADNDRAVNSAYAGLIQQLVEAGYDASDFTTYNGLPVMAGGDPAAPAGIAGVQGPMFNTAAVWAAVRREQQRGRFTDLPQRREEYEAQVLQRMGQQMDEANARAAQGPLWARFAGGFAGAMTDPINQLTLGVGGGGRTAFARIVTEGLANAAVEAAQQPVLAANRERQGRELALEEAGMNVGFAFIGGSALRGAGEVAGPLARAINARAGEAVTAALDRLPQGLRDRWRAHLLSGAELPDNPVLLADLTEAIIGRDNMGGELVQAVDGLRITAQVDASNPFTRNGGADALHDALARQVAAEALATPAFQQPVAVTARPIRTDRATPRPAEAPRPVMGPAGNAEEMFMGRVRGAESGGDDAARNPRSSATGRYQFTDGTWLAYYRRRFGQDGKTNEQVLALRGDGALQDQLMRDLTADNARALRSGGEAVTPGNLYLAHFAGPRGALDVLRADPETPLWQVLGNRREERHNDVIRANPQLQGKTADWLVRWAAGKMDSPVPRRGGARITIADDDGMTRAIAANEAERAAIQDALDLAVARADAAEAAQRVARGEEPAPADILAEAADWEPVLVDRDLADLPEPTALPDVETILPALREVVATPRRSINQVDAIAAELGVDPMLVRRGLTQLALDGEIRMVVKQRGRTKGARGRPRWMTDAEEAAARGGAWDGEFSRIYARNTREDMLAFIARQGGIDPSGAGAAGRAVERRRLGLPEDGSGDRGAFGHDLRNTGNLGAHYVHGVGKLVRRNGKGLDEIGEALVDAGYLRERPTEGELILLLDDVLRRGEKVYIDGASTTASERQQAARDAEGLTEQDKLEIVDEWMVDSLGYQVDDLLALNLRSTDLRQIVRMMREGTELLEPLDADTMQRAAISPDEHIDRIAPFVLEHLNREADEVLYNLRVEAEDDAYDLATWDLERGEAGRPDQGGDGPARDTADAGAGTGPAGQAAAPQSGIELARLPEAERTQFIDPDGPAAKAQGDSLAHDARAVLDATTNIDVVRSSATEDGFFLAMRDLPDTVATEDALAAARSRVWAEAEAAGTLDETISRFDAARDRWTEQFAASREAASVAERARMRAEESQLAEAIATRVNAGQAELRTSNPVRNKTMIYGPGTVRNNGGTLEVMEGRNWVAVPGSDLRAHAAAMGIRPEAAPTINPDGQMDFAAPTQDQARIALERQGEGRMAGAVPQKPPGSDGGLFDVRATDLEFRLEAEGEPTDLRGLLDDLDAEEADLKNIRDCL